MIRSDGNFELSDSGIFLQQWSFISEQQVTAIVGFASLPTTVRSALCPCALFSSDLGFCLAFFLFFNYFAFITYSNKMSLLLLLAVIVVVVVLILILIFLVVEVVILFGVVVFLVVVLVLVKVLM